MEETKKPKCNYCKEEITELIAFSEISQNMQLMDNGEPSYSSHDYCEGFTEFDCPECHEKLCVTEKQAIRFLEGIK